MTKKKILLLFVLMLISFASSAQKTSAYDKGMQYFNNKDYANALKWFKKAAKNGDAKAFNQMGIIYMDGLEVPKDYDKAWECFRKAESGGSVAAITNQGLMYKNGLGVTQNYAKALELFQKSGTAYAMNEIGKMYEEGLGVAKNYDGIRRLIKIIIKTQNQI